VLLRLHSADVVHQFYVPALELGPVTVEPGHVSEIEFRVKREGVFQYYCTSMCGECHFYMTGWIVVTAPGKTPLRPKPIVCTLCVPEAPPPIEQGIVAQGEYLYRRKGCGACHGPEGRGGVPNYNYLNGEIVDHVHMADRLFLRDEESANRFLEWVAESGCMKEPGEPEIDGFPVVKARLLAAMKLIRDGKNAAKADLAGPEPPLQMPAWKHKLTENEMLSVMAYLISLNPWGEETEDHVAVNARR
jgi:mono/diheme cytochrome c family protein